MNFIPVNIYNKLIIKQSNIYILNSKPLLTCYQLLSCLCMKQTTYLFKTIIGILKAKQNTLAMKLGVDYLSKCTMIHVLSNQISSFHVS